MFYFCAALGLLAGSALVASVVTVAFLSVTVAIAGKKPQPLDTPGKCVVYWCK